MRRSLLILLAIVCTAVAGVAQPTQKGHDFVNGPFGLLLTAEEKAALSQAKTDLAAEELIRGVWARRARPDASAEQVRLDFEARVAAADKQFGEPGAISRTMRVPASLPSVTHSSRP